MCGPTEPRDRTTSQQLCVTSGGLNSLTAPPRSHTGSVCAFSRLLCQAALKGQQLVFVHYDTSRALGFMCVSGDVKGKWECVCVCVCVVQSSTPMLRNR